MLIHIIGKKRRTIIIRYLIVGIVNTLVGLTSVLLLFNLLNFNYWVSSFVGNVFGILVSFFLNKKYTFKSQNKIVSALFKFILVSLFCYIISYSIGYVISLKNIIGNWTLASNLSILFSSGLYTILGYLGHKKITFASK
ncbi:GtrA family protein [Paenibacillus polymyxa]|uniref:GtrA family protein n=1 Tax=Paenibacillus polymyxa TaxID=1406 RepID=UPI001C2EE5ED|nr:GtrA family protein [Paenibacillus polymyxa]MBZ6444044.1 GtrA family protein [Paenibacillus polymyxa]